MNFHMLGLWSEPKEAEDKMCREGNLTDTLWDVETEP